MIREPNELRDSMLEQVRLQGELKIPDYWKQALTDSKLGYYIHQNVFSTEGDFVTSPEISSLFG
jgi:NADH dehydrogenase [ubiquinone] 1 alpha subcomplex assembly factor 7